MATTAFGNSYTFTIIGETGSYQEFLEQITKSAVEVIEYLSRYIDWQGTIDFVVQFRSPGDGKAHLPAYSNYVFDIDLQQFSYAALIEGQGGGDVNNASSDPFDAGAQIIPDANGNLLNYDRPLWFGDGSQFPYRSPPSNKDDFASIFLHEVVHSFGINTGWVDRKDTIYDNHVDYSGTVPLFTGPNTVALLGRPLTLDPNQPDHYTGVSRGLMHKDGNYERNSLELGQIDLMMLKDLGWSVRNVDELPLVEEHGSPLPSADIAALFTAHPNTAWGLAAAYEMLLGGVPNKAGFVALIQSALSTNYGAGAGPVFNAENIFINLTNNLVQGNDSAGAAFRAIAQGATLTEKITAIYKTIIPASYQSADGLAYLTRADGIAFYQKVAGERGVAGAEGAAIVAMASLMKITVDQNIGIGNSVNDLIRAVLNGSDALPASGNTLTDIEVADGNYFDGDDGRAMAAYFAAEDETDFSAGDAVYEYGGDVAWLNSPGIVGLGFNIDHA